MIPEVGSLVAGQGDLIKTGGARVELSARPLLLGYGDATVISRPPTSRLGLANQLRELLDDAKRASDGPLAELARGARLGLVSVGEPRDARMLFALQRQRALNLVLILEQ